MRFPRHLLAALAFAAGAFALQPAQAAWPERPIEMICATSPGSGAANWCQLFAEMVGENLGQPVKVLFKGGGAGNEAADYVAGKPADGYTWLQRNTSYAGYMNLPTFQPDPEAFEVVVEVEKFLYIVGVPGDSKYQTFEDVIEDMKANPGKVSVATNKPGSAHHVHMIKLFDAFGADWNFVPYQGAGGAMKDTLGGHVPVAIGPPGIWLPHVEAGKARFLLLLNEEHVDRPGLKDLPIPADFGKSYDFSHQIQGMFVLADTPEEVKDRVGEAFKAAVESDRYKAYVEKNPHVVPAFNADRAEATARFHAIREEIGKFLRESGLI